MAFKKGNLPWNKGNKGIHLSLSSEFKKGRTPWNKGLKTGLVPKTAFVKGQLSGEKHHLWNGGSSKGYRKGYTKPEFKLWRKLVFTRDDFTCQACGEREGKYKEAHHIKPWAKFPLLRFVVDNGVTLCNDCHREIHLFDKCNNSYSFA